MPSIHIAVRTDCTVSQIHSVGSLPRLDGRQSYRVRLLRRLIGLSFQIEDHAQACQYLDEHDVFSLLIKHAISRKL